MKTLRNHKLILFAVVVFMMASCAYSSGPDNAAVLYREATAIYIDGEAADSLRDLRKGKIKLNDKIREFVEENRSVINIVLDASEMKNCDWELDFSRGFEMEIPHLTSFRKLSYLIVADAKILSESGDYKSALSRCISLYKMARHINDKIFISYLVGIGVNAIANDCVIQTMSDMPQDINSLTFLRNQLVEIENIPFSIKPALLQERDVILMYMTKEKMADLVGIAEDRAVKKRILSFDEAMIDRNKKYFEDYWAGVIAAFDMPYTEGYAALEDLTAKLEKDAKSNPDATLTSILVPSTHNIFSLTTRSQTHYNAIMAAVELYMIKAIFGELPDALPLGLRGDMFSSNSFYYEKTPEGFILHCQSKDFRKDKIYEYEFKVKN